MIEKLLLGETQGAQIDKINALIDEVSNGSGGVENVMVDVVSMIANQDVATFKSLTERYVNGEIVITAIVETTRGIVTGVNYASDTNMDWTVAVPTTWFNHVPGVSVIDDASMLVFVLNYNGATLSLVTNEFPLPKGEATTDEAGLMSASDKKKLNGIREGATSVQFSQKLASGTEIGQLLINGVVSSIYAPSGGAGGLPTFSTVVYSVNLTETGFYLLLGSPSATLLVGTSGSVQLNSAGIAFLRIENSGYYVYNETSGLLSLTSGSFGSASVGGGISVNMRGSAFKYCKLAVI